MTEYVDTVAVEFPQHEFEGYEECLLTLNCLNVGTISLPQWTNESESGICFKVGLFLLVSGQDLHPISEVVQPKVLFAFEEVARRLPFLFAY